MSDELARIRERLVQARQARGAAMSAVGGLRRSPDVGLVASFEPGDHVFDTVTGQEGVVVGRASQISIVQPRSG